MICYLVMGWCIIFKINLLPQAVGMNGIWLLVSGGLAYTIGVIFYVLQNKIKYMHSIWHLWILVGSILHFLCIILYVFIKIININLMKSFVYMNIGFFIL